MEWILIFNCRTKDNLKSSFEAIRKMRIKTIKG